MKKTFMRTVGVLSTAAMLAVGAKSITASAEGTAKFSMEKKYAQPGETVEMSMSVENLDTAWTGLEFVVDFDPKLEIAVDDAGDVEYSYGTAIGSAGKKISVGSSVAKNLTDEGMKRIAYAWGTASAISGNGSVCTFKFTVPADAQPGDKFPVGVGVKTLIDGNKDAIAFENEAGWIQIPAETSTETETTTTTTTTTTEGAAETSAPVVTTSAVTTTKTPDVKPPKMGVDGAALGVVGMLSAAAAAAVVLKKKKD